MRRLLIVLAAASLLGPARAAAAPLGELPSTVLAGAGSCLHDTGAPGELVHDTDAPTEQGTPVELLRSGPGGFAPAGTTLLAGQNYTCSAVAGRPDGAAILAVALDAQGGPEIVAASRPAGGTFPAPVPIAHPGGTFVDEVVAAMSARGDAVVAWREASRSGRRTRVRAVLRPAGGAFGAPVVVAAGRSLLGLVAGMSAGGEAVLAWADLGRPALPRRERVLASIAPAGGRFGPARLVGTAASDSGPELAVADDGRALLALPVAGTARVAERPPGGTFARPVRLARTGADEVALALGTGGRAAVVWASGATGSASMVTRAAAGAFGRPVTLAPRSTSGAARARAIVVSQLGGVGGDFGAFEEEDLAVTLTPEGALAAWLAPRRFDGLGTSGVRTAFVPAGGGPVERSALGGGLRDATNVVTFPAAGGSSGVAWLEQEPGTNAPVRLHAAVVAGTRPPDPPAPAVHIGRPRRSLLKYSDPVSLPVTCSAACDLRVQRPDGTAEGALSLARAGHGVLHVYALGAPLARLRGGPVRLRLLYGAPGAAHPAVRTLSVRLRLRALPVWPHPYGLRARRLAGDRIRVTWATRVATRDATFVVGGAARRGGRASVLDAARGTRRRRRFALTLPQARGVRVVTLYTFVGFSKHRLVVRVR